jgi:hypothetical protein
MKKIFSIGLVLSYAIHTFSQSSTDAPLTNSPLSRLGLGDFVNNNFAASAGFGGLSATYNDAYHLNILNPAASANLQSTAYEIGVYAKRSTLDDGNQTNDVWGGHINYLALGFPLRNQINELLDRKKKSPMKWGMTFALLPYTNVGYNIQSVQKLPNVDTVISAYRGRGGTYKLMWGNSMNYKGLAVGLNVGALFGTINNDRIIGFYNLVDDYEGQFQYKSKYNGFVWNLGVQYTYDIKKKVGSRVEPSGRKITIGAFGNPAQRFNSSSTQTIRRINYSYTNATGSDTLFKERLAGVKGSGRLPTEIVLGAMYQKENKLRIGINYAAAFWSQYRNTIQNDRLKNGYTLSTGIEYTPEYNSYNSYLKRIRYRFGATIGNDPRTIKDEQIKNKSLSVGLGFPLIMPRQQISFVDITFELGQLGASTFTDTYGRLILGFTMNDNSWFYKRRFN